MAKLISLIGAGLLTGIASLQISVAQAQVHVDIHLGVPIIAAPILYSPPPRSGYIWIQAGRYGQGRERYWRNGHWQATGYRTIEYQPARFRDRADWDRTQGWRRHHQDDDDRRHWHDR